jgi:hypothetical protein
MPFASTKSFTARWESSFLRPVTGRLVYDPENPDTLAGTLVNRLDTSLEDAVLFYGGKWYTFADPLAPGRPAALAGQSGQDFIQWQNSFSLRRGTRAGVSSVTVMINNLLFHDKMSLAGNKRRDNTLRYLDQSWRLREPNARDVRIQEAILYARLGRIEGSAADVGKDPAAPSRLVLTESSSKGANREAPATVVQDTYVRVFLPVVPAK